jgi:hypothetical protein
MCGMSATEKLPHMQALPIRCIPFIPCLEGGTTKQSFTSKHVNSYTNNLKPRAFYMYHLLWYRESLHSVHRVYLYVWSGFHYKHPLLS